MVVVSLDNFEKFDVVKPLPHQEQLKKWLKLGARIAGGFPVWAAGFSSRYTDIICMQILGIPSLVFEVIYM